MATRETLTSYGILVLAIASFGGLLFGYHAAIISGALVFLTPLFDLTPRDEGVVVSVMVLGGLAGSLFSGYLADHFGRKKAMILATFFFIAGGLVIACAHQYWEILLGRVISGLGAGIATVSVPLFLAEIAPPHYRGRSVSAFQLAMALGILLSYCIAFVFSGGQKWEMLFIIGSILAVLQLLFLFFIPETPSWSLTHGKASKGIKALHALRKDNLWQKEIDNTQKKAPEKTSWRAFFQPHMPYILLLGFLLSIFQQITGINAIIYYTPKIFSVAGITSSQGVFFATMSVGVVNFLATLFAIWILDKLGRRKVLLIGSLGMVISLGIFSSGFSFKSSFMNILSIGSVLSYVAFFAFSLGPVIWVLLSEMFPLKIRGNAMACAVALNWIANYGVSLTFPDMISVWGGGWTFAMFALISLASFLFVYWFISETKGKSLQQIEKLVNSGKF